MERAIRQRGNAPLLSIAGVWEIAIKVQLGTLPIPTPLDTFIPEQLQANRIELLPLNFATRSRLPGCRCIPATHSTGSWRASLS